AARFPTANADPLPAVRSPVSADAKQRTAARGEYGADDWHDPRDDGQLPDVYSAMGQTAENLARHKGISRERMDEFGVRSQNLAEQAIADGFWAKDITPVKIGRASWRETVAAGVGGRAA